MKDQFYYQRIGSIMRDNQFDRTVSGFRSGQLGKKLYKVSLDNDRVFDRKVEHANKKYWVVMMIDESGSMGSSFGSKIHVAASSVCKMAKALDKSHIEFCILGFNSFTRVHKRFDEHPKPKVYDDMIREIMVAPSSQGCGCTHDWQAVIQTQEMIRGLPPDNTIVMLFVDGQPGCGCHYNGADPGGQLKVQAQKLAKKSKFITFSIFRDYDSEHYPNVVVINNLDEFMTRSLYALQAIIHRG